MSPRNPSPLSEDDVHLFNEGTHYRLYDKLGSRPCTIDGQQGAWFAVWAPNADRVSVIGDFNGWDKGAHPLHTRGGSGIWEGFVPGAHKGTIYKYHIVSRVNGYTVDKADPYAFMHETPPRTGSVVWDLDYQWGDDAWMKDRARRNRLDAPISVYEVHLGSWMRVPEEGGRHLSYRELAHHLVDYVRRMGFTHVELMPPAEHPFYGSWGYQLTGYFAPTSRYGTPQDFMYLVDRLHQANIGVIIDWVPAHFPTDEHGLGYFDGTHLYEHADPRQGFHPDWRSWIFNYGRREVRSFLLSSALFWLDHYHVDGLRVDGVASMLYLDYSRQPGEWIPNAYGGRENIEAISFLRHMNDSVHHAHPDCITVAEESTAWPMVTRSPELGGLGFDMKWDMGWMHDTLKYISNDPVHRSFHHGSLTFRMVYAFHEHFMMPLSHDEVVHGKGSLIGKMPGDEWQKRANLRLLLAYQWAQPGKKLLFMGGEIGQYREWNHDSSVDWHLVEHHEGHRGIQRLVETLNRIYREEPALHRRDAEPAGFEWIYADDAENSVIAFLRRAEPRASFDAGDRPDAAGDVLVAVFNFTPVVRHNYRIGVDRYGWWDEVLNTDDPSFGGSGVRNEGGRETSPIAWQGRRFSLSLTLPPLGALFLKARPTE